MDADERAAAAEVESEAIRAGTTPPRRFRVLRSWPFVVVFVAHLLRYLSCTPVDYRPGGDGFYIYLLARSLAFDGDVDMANDYAMCGDPWHHGIDFGTGHLANPYYIGPSTLWAPALAVFRHVIRLPATASPSWRNGCTGPLPFAVGLLGPVIVTLTVWLGYRVARRYVARGPAIAAVLVVAFGSGLNTFGTLWWPYSHAWAACALTAAVLALQRTLEQPERWTRWWIAGMAIGWASLMRPHHGVFLLAPALFTVVRMVGIARRRRWPVREALDGLVALAGFVAVASIRFATYRYMYGSIFPPVTGSLYIQPLHAHPFLLLFSAEAGLLYQAPLMWFAVVGFFDALLRSRGSLLFAFLAVPLLLDFWVCASPVVWTSSATVGPRLLVSFTGIFLVFSALSLARLASWATRTEQRLRSVAATTALLPALLLSWQLISGEPPFDMPSIYGTAAKRLASNVDAFVGNPFTLPGTIVFAARYGTHPRNFDKVARYGMFRHRVEDATVECCDTLMFGRPPEEFVLTEGRPTSARGLTVTAHEPASFLIPLAWPWVTHLRITYAPRAYAGACQLRVRSGQFSYRTRLPSIATSADGGVAEIAVPPRAFDSGINEITFGATCEVTVQSVTFIDRTPHRTETSLTRSRAAGSGRTGR